MKKIDLATTPTKTGTRYPAPYDQPCIGRHRWMLADAANARLTQFGVNLLHLPAGQWSSQRHWHAREDEFIYVLEGEVVLVTDAGEEILRAGDCAGFKAGDPDGHHLQNRGTQKAVILEVGTRDPQGDTAVYPDIDLILPGGGAGYAHRNGTPYTKG